MRGPCSVGFHIPLITELQGFISVLTTLGITTQEQAETKLHLPPMGERLAKDASIDFRDRCYYWSSSKYTSSTSTSYPGAASAFVADYNGVSTSLIPARANGFPIRGFKDAYATPTSSWTVVQGTLGGAGVFRNQTDGLISITDGTTGYTIQDKNVGATTVYNYGNTLTTANMGNMYQWGNNYGFPPTGNVSTSSTKVDASGYGPGNYYSSSTFITVTDSTQDWSSVHNDNLWGGVTGIQPIGYPIKNAYIGGYYEYSYTFKGKTAAEVGNEFDVLVGTITVNSDGFSGNECVIKKDIPSLTNAKRIIVTATVVGQSKTTTAAQFGIGKGTSWGTGGADFQIYGSTYNGIKAHLYYSGTDYNGNNVGNATGTTYNSTVTIDLENKTITGEISGFSNSVVNLTDEQVNDIRTHTYLKCYVSAQTSTISDVSIKIEK